MQAIIQALKSNWAKYLIEALVITFSIIGAFILDNWNKNRGIRNAELRALITTYEDRINDAKEEGKLIQDLIVDKFISTLEEENKRK